MTYLRHFLLSFLFTLCAFEILAQDTTLVIPPSRSEQDSVQFYSKLKNLRAKSKFLALMYDLLIVDPHTDTLTSPKNQLLHEYESMDGKIIRKINIQVLDVFGTSIYNSQKKANNILERFGNSVHIETRPFIVKNILLFSENTEVTSGLLYESERLLRKQRFILDARLKPYLIGNDSVDIDVVVQDLWSITPELMFDPFMPQGFLELQDVNFLGTGQTGFYRFQFRNDSVLFIRNAGSYYIPNIKSTYIDGEFRFKYDENIHMAELNFKRPFFSPITRTAYGITINRSNVLTEIWENEKLKERIFLGSTTFDKWIARSFYVVPKQHPLYDKTKWVIGLRLKSLHANNTENRVSNYYSSYLLLGESGFSYRNYYKDRLLYQYGRTEDVAEGLLTKIIYGIEWSRFNPRYYLGTHIKLGKHLGKFGYWAVDAGIGQFFQGNKQYDGSLLTRCLYFSDLIQLGRWKNRFFSQINYTKALNMAHDRFVYLNNDDGLRAFDNPFLRGKDKLIIKLHIIMFSPYHLVGFRFAGIIFSDLALLSDFQRPLLKSPVYKSLGFGITLRNDRLFFQTLEIVFSFTPDFPFIPQKPIRTWDVNFDLHQPITTDIFYFDRPEVIPYR